MSLRERNDWTEEALVPNASAIQSFILRTRRGLFRLFLGRSGGLPLPAAFLPDAGGVFCLWVLNPGRLVSPDRLPSCRPAGLPVLRARPRGFPVRSAGAVLATGLRCLLGLRGFYGVLGLRSRWLREFKIVFAGQVVEHLPYERGGELQA